MKDISDYITSLDTGGAIPLADLKPNQSIIAQHPGDMQWYRAEIVSLNEGSSSAEVLFVDYGNRAEVQLSGLKVTPLQFMKLPKQAMICTLSGIQSVSGEWSSDAVLKFDELARRHDHMTATVVSATSVLEVKLRSDSCADFVQELVASGLARLIAE